MSLYEPEDYKKELRIAFINEAGIDHGGVKKEWFQMVCQKIFNPEYGISLKASGLISQGMFIENAATRTFWFNIAADASTLGDYKLIGILLGMAIYNGVILDIRFPSIVFKKLLKLPTSFEDLKDVYPVKHNSLTRCNRNRIFIKA